MASPIPDNRASFTIEEVLSATGGRLLRGRGAETVGVCTDTRKVTPGCLFVALAGERFDGHRFAQVAHDKGAALLLVEREVEVTEDATVVLVASSLSALGHLGARHRNRWGGPVLAVAGSVGKTTTRSSLASVLRAAGRKVHCPSGNLNNRVGVPLVLLGLEQRHEVAVVELGTSLPGEVALLVEVARPDIAILTRISIEHSEGLGDLDAIELEEGAVLRGLGSEAIAVVNRDDSRCLRQLGTRKGGRYLLYGRRERGAQDVSVVPSQGTATLQYTIEDCVVTGPETTAISISRSRDGSVLTADSPLLGAPGAYALAASLAASEAHLGRSVSQKELSAALASPELGEPGRLCPVELGDGSLVLDDTYNSSPASVVSSAEIAAGLALRRGGRLILVLGEMRELGRESAAIHERVGRELAGFNPDLVVAFGGDARHLVDSSLPYAGCLQFFEDSVDEVASVVLSNHQSSDVILVKSSRGLRAERIVQTLVEKLGKRS